MEYAKVVAMLQNNIERNPTHKKRDMIVHVAPTVHSNF